MFDGFRPELQGWFFERRILSSAATLAVLFAGATAYVVTLEGPEKTIEVALGDPELSDFSVEAEEPEEPEVAQEEPADLPPPPPPDAKVQRVKKPTPRPKPVTPVAKPTEAADTSDTKKVYEVPMDGRTSPTGTGANPGKSASTGQAKKPAKPKPKPEPKPKPKADKQPLDPTKPVDRPENATVPKPLPSNTQPSYPKKLREEGITGRVVLKLHVHRDGSVRGAKVLSKKNSATTEDEKKAASAAFLKSVIEVVKSWRFTPATLAGEPISVWHEVNIPFELTN